MAVPPLALQATGSDGDGDAELLFGYPRATVTMPLIQLLLCQLVLFVGVGAVIPSLPLYGKAIGLSASTSGVVISAPAVALLLGARGAGTFADVARKPAMILGMAVITVADLGTAAATSLVPLVIARLALGAGRCVSESGERAMLADLANRAPGLRGRALAAQQAAAALGVAVGAPLGGIVIEAYGARASFLCVSAAAFIAGVGYCFLPETKGKGRDGQDLVSGSGGGGGGGGGAEGGGGVVQAGSGAWRVLLQERQWRGIALAEGCAKFGFAAKIASVPVIAAAVLPGGAAGAGALLSAAGLSGLVGAPLGGAITDRIGE